jgi:hypothetical protein
MSETVKSMIYLQNCTGRQLRKELASDISLIVLWLYLYFDSNHSWPKLGVAAFVLILFGVHSYECLREIIRRRISR